MANPRKFSDKLEIIRRKEEEANAAFVQIMREVSDARKTTGPGGPQGAPMPHSSWARSPNELMNMKQRFKGGSLPNVNMSQNPMAMQGVFPHMGDIYGNRPIHHPQQSHGYVGHGVAQGHLRRMDPSGPIYPSKNKRSYTVHANAPYRSNVHHPPPQNNSLLPGSNDSGSMWRRTFSDSAIQQTLQQPPKKNTDGLMNQQSSPRSINTAPISIDSNEAPFPGSPPVSYSSSTAYSNEAPTAGKHIQMAANTSSLPDLSNLSIPSPIQTPLDGEQENQNKLQQTSPDPQHAYQVPYRVPPRRSVGKQIYSRQLGSNPDVLESIHREQKLNLNLFPGSGGGMNMNSDKIEASMNSSTSVTHSAPLSPVTPPPYYWSSTPMSPLATSDLIHQVSQQQSELQQQMSQFQIHSDNMNNGMGNPPPYPYLSESGENVNNFNYPYNKQNLYRMNSGPSQLSSHQDSKLMCDRQLETELLKIKAQDNANNGELSEADLNSVRVALDPLDFNDVQILSGNNTELVDQSAEEEFRLERASYQ